MNVPCPTCGGSGKWVKPLPPGLWMIHQEPCDCPSCNGLGTVWQIQPIYPPPLPIPAGTWPPSYYGSTSGPCPNAVTITVTN